MSVETSANELPGALPKIYLAMIFDSSAEGVELKAELNTDLDSLKSSAKRKVDQLNSSNPMSFVWNGSAYYPEDMSTDYEGFYWVRIQEIHPGLTFTISEYA